MFDLGRDVDPEEVCRRAAETGCRLVGLSALMTTTVPSMEETIRMLHERCPGVTVIVGGAVLNEEYAEMIHADKYCEDAMDIGALCSVILFRQRLSGGGRDFLKSHNTPTVKI